jgi:hypothetical protein
MLIVVNNKYSFVDAGVFYPHVTLASSYLTLFGCIYRQEIDLRHQSHAVYRLRLRESYANTNSLQAKHRLE